MARDLGNLDQRPARETAHTWLLVIHPEYTFACIVDEGPHIPCCDRLTALIEAERARLLREAPTTSTQSPKSPPETPGGTRHE